jgi:hypothetical protein
VGGTVACAGGVLAVELDGEVGGTVLACASGAAMACGEVGVEPEEVAVDAVEGSLPARS